MKFFWALVGFLGVLVISISEAQSAVAVPNSPDLVRVRLLTVSKKIQISGMSLRFQNRTSPYRSVAIPNSGNAEVRLMEKDGKKFWALRLNNQDREHLFTEKYMMIQGDGLRAGPQSLPSQVLLAANGSQKVDVIGVVPLEEYVVGVLSSEMPGTWPKETLKAQAVAIRSYTAAVVEERKDRAYHVESNVLDQVFRHVMDDENDGKIKRAMQAVNETKGQRLLGPNHKVLKAFYHADCGGKTTTAKNVWNGGVDAGVAVDSSCPTGPHAMWQLRLTKAELQKRLNVNDLSHLALLKFKGDERVKAVRVAMNDGAEQTINANEFRQMLGFQALRSTDFEMKESGSEIVFTGKGFGHGVGLCQWGSRAMGKQGLNYQAILKHYYPLAKLM